LAPYEISTACRRDLRRSFRDVELDFELGRSTTVISTASCCTAAFCVTETLPTMPSTGERIDSSPAALEVVDRALLTLELQPPGLHFELHELLLWSAVSTA
jgi:hypothetical protein